jgi:hypothetical protein
MVAVFMLGVFGMTTAQSHGQPIAAPRPHVVAIAYPSWQLDGAAPTGELDGTTSNWQLDG